jgi:catechol 2,3-dioxygenase-like lactoylglutathione lyase family enzyme
VAAQEPTYVLDHVGLPVSDLDTAKAFYTAALEPLGFSLIMEFPGAVGFGLRGQPQLWLHQGAGTPSAPIHIALHAEDHARVHAFHAAALAAGGTDNGPPGPRPHYHPGYYAAYVKDADGNNVEAVHHGDPSQP